MIKKFSILLLFTLSLSGCEEVNDAIEIVEDVSQVVEDVSDIAEDVSDIANTVKETAETIQEIKKPESKKLSSKVNLEGIFPIEIFDEDPGFLTFTKDISKHIAKFDKTFEVTYRGNMEWNALEEQLNDINNALTHIDPYIAGYFLHYTWQAWDNDDGSTLVEFKIDYWTDAEKEKYVDAAVEEFVYDYIDEDMSDFERAKTVNDYIIQLASYTDKGSSEGQSAYELVYNGTGVCQAYALLGYRLFEEAGLDADYVYGYSDDVLHAWNMVKVDSNWYHVDITWNDFDTPESYAISYEYFLKSNKQLSQDHLWMNTNYAKANDDYYSFMHDMWYADTENTTIYYSSIKDSSLYSYNWSTGDQLQLLKSRTYYIEAEGNDIYFSDYSNGGYLTWMNTKTGETKVLYEQEVLNLLIDDNTLYFDTPDGETQSYSL